MSYGAKYRFTHYDINNVKWEIDILEDGYASSVTEKKLTGDMFTLTYESGAIKEGRLEMQFLLEGSGDRTIAEGLIGQGDTKYICKLKKAGSDYWQGYLVSDLVEITEGDYPGVATITAKDLLSLNQEFARDTDITVANNDKLIELFAEVLPFDIGIRTYTDWTQSNLSAGDFLNQIYVDRYAFRQVNPGADDTNLTQKQVLENLLFATDTQLIQADGVWQLMQRDNLDNATYTRYNYLASGAQGSPASTSSVNLDQTVDGSNTYVLPASTAYWVGGLKRNRYAYQHNSKTYGMVFDASYNLTSGTETISQFFIADGSQQIRFAFDFEARINEDLGFDSEIVVNVKIRAGSVGNYAYWNGSSWTTDSTVGGVTVVGKSFATYTLYRDTITITTDAVPDTNDGTLSVILQMATLTGKTVEYTNYSNLSLDIFTGTDANDSAELIYLYSNDGPFSVSEDYGTTLVGEGPTPSTRGAVRYLSGGIFTLTSGGWTRSGLTENLGLNRLILRSRMDYYRKPRKTLRGEIWGSYDAYKILSWDSKRWAFERGTLVGLTGQWRSTFFIEINPETASSLSQTDTLNTLVVDVTATTSTGSTGSTTGEVDTGALNALYLQKANNLSDVANTATARQNLDLEIGVDVQAYDADLTAIAGLTPTDSNIIVGNGTTWVAESGATARTSLGLGTGDSPTFAGLTVDTNTLYVDSANNEVGIGTTSPNAKLDVRGSAIFNENGGDNDFRVEGDTDTHLLFVDASTDRVGIGASAPDSILHIANTNPTVKIFSGNSSGNSSILSFGKAFDGDTTIEFRNTTSGTPLVGQIKCDSIEDIIFHTNPDGTLASDGDFVFKQSTNERLRIDSVGNVGIGTTSPAGKLNVSGDGLWITDNTTAYIALRSGNSSSSGANIALASGDLTFVTRTTSNTERMRITSGGDVQNPSFSSGFSGSKWQITEAGSAEFGSLTVRGSLKAYELIVKQISTIGGTEILSVAQGKVEAVNTGTGVITVQSVSGAPAQPFTTNDVVMIQSSNMETSGESGIGFTVRRVAFTIATTSSNTITIDSFLTGSVSDIQVGDVMVVIGSLDTQRDSLMYRNVDRDEDRLIMRVQKGVQNLTQLYDASKTRIAFGDIGDYTGGAYSETFGFFAGTLSANHALITPSGFFLKDGTDTLAELSAGKFRVGASGGNRIEYDGSSFTLQASTFNLASGSIAIGDSATVPSPTIAKSATLLAQYNYDTNAGPINSSSIQRDNIDQVVCVKYDISTDFVGLNDADLAIRIQGSQNNSTWTTIKENVYGIIASFSASNVVLFSGTDEYEYYRLQWQVYNYNGGGNFITIDYDTDFDMQDVTIGINSNGIFTNVAGVTRNIFSVIKNL